MNPNDVSEKKVEELLGAGINRVSLGIQSYINKELQALGRNHDRKSAIQATKILEDVNSTIDLIYGIEKQTPKSFTESLGKIIQSDINHLSLYQLTIEPNTIFYKKELKLPNEEEIDKIESVAKNLLEKNGYRAKGTLKKVKKIGEELGFTIDYERRNFQDWIIWSSDE